MAIGTKFNDYLVEKLKDPELAARYIMNAIKENDPAYLSKAMSNVIKAHGTTKIAKASHLSRQALYKMFSPKGNPSLQSMTSVLDAVGLKISIEPKRKKSA